MFERWAKQRWGSFLRPVMYFLLGAVCLKCVQAFFPKVRPPEKSSPAEPRTYSGQFEYVRFGLQEPEGLLPDTSQPLPPTRWYFGQRSVADVLKLLSDCGATAPAIESFTKRTSWETSDEGLYALPSTEFVLDLEPSVRSRLYALLEESPRNSAQRNPFRFRPESFMEWFADTGLGPEQLHILKKLLYREGCTLGFCDGAVVQGLFSETDFHRLVKALYEERTFLMRLRIAADTDVEGLLRYWSKGDRADVLRPLLESLVKAPASGPLNISYLLPPFARLRLYTYPTPSDSAGQNCFWTALNFYSRTPDDRFADPTIAAETLKKNYELITSPPTMGDVVSITEGNRPIHMCVYLADEVVFTKNGKHRIDPWVLMKLPEVLADYQVEGAVRISYFRPRTAAN